MKKSERPASMGLSPDAPQAQPTPSPQSPAPERPRRAKGSSRGYNPYDTVNTRFPDVWDAKPKRS